MSNPGMNPLTMQQVLDYQRQQDMAAALMGQNAPANQPYAGVSNAGSNIAGALMDKGIQNRMAQVQDPENQALQQRYGMSADQVSTMLNPGAMSRAGSWLSNLFSLGGK